MGTDALVSLRHIFTGEEFTRSEEPRGRTEDLEKNQRGPTSAAHCRSSREPKEMASKPVRRDSKELPPDLSDLMNKLRKDSDCFLSQLNARELKMREIVEELLKVSEEVKVIQRAADSQRVIGVGVMAAGIAGGAVLAVLTGGLALLPLLGGAAAAVGGAELAAAAGVAAGGGGAVVYANVTKLMSEKGKAELVEELGKEFMETVEPMKQTLEEIHGACKDLEEELSESDAEQSLKDVEEFQMNIQRVSELKKRSEGAVYVHGASLPSLANLMELLGSFLRLTATPEEDKQLRDAIIQSADQSQRVTNDFCLVREDVTAVLCENTAH